MDRFEFLERDFASRELGIGDLKKDYLELRKSGSLGVAAKGLLNLNIIFAYIIKSIYNQFQLLIYREITYIVYFFIKNNINRFFYFKLMLNIDEKNLGFILKFGLFIILLLKLKVIFKISLKRK